MSLRRVGSTVAGLTLLWAAGCSGPELRRAEYDEALFPLARSEGWRQYTGSNPYGILEIAADRQTAELAWVENVRQQAAADWERAENGVYGSLDDVDFESQAVVVWSGGQLGACPGYLANVESEPSGVVVTELGGLPPRGGGDGCSALFTPYQLVLAVDRERLPALDDLPTEDVLITSASNPTGLDDGVVASYPWEDYPEEPDGEADAGAELLSY